MPATWLRWCMMVKTFLITYWRLVLLSPGSKKAQRLGKGPSFFVANDTSQSFPNRARTSVQCYWLALLLGLGEGRDWLATYMLPRLDSTPLYLWGEGHKPNEA
ncbi:MAG: hypothetical protein RIF36_21835 [Imperialibacter sp.]|uniref:hypothetical protein n=1 Tax=Imperialibacter sp. TaxID=2038411 RepID=UPI0032ECEC98